MTQKTSWEGLYTRTLRKQGKLKGAYTRYLNRRSRTGLQVVKNRKNYNDVFSPNGAFLGREIKYRNYSTQEREARKIYNQQIKKYITPKIAKTIIR